MARDGWSRHTGDHGAYVLQQNESILVIDSAVKRPFILGDGETFEERGTVWSYNDKMLMKTKKNRVNILSN